MATIDITVPLTATLVKNTAAFRTLVDRYHTDPDYRGQIEADPVAAFREQGIELPGDIEIRVVANTDSKRYMVLPHDPNIGLNDEILSAVAGGDTLGSAGSASSFSTLATAGGTVSTATSFGTAGTVGTADT